MQVIFGSVDGVHFRIQEPRKQPNTNWKSHKSNGPGYSYEVALSLYDMPRKWQETLQDSFVVEQENDPFCFELPSGSSSWARQTLPNPSCSSIFKSIEPSSLERGQVTAFPCLLLIIGIRVILTFRTLQQPKISASAWIADFM